MSHAELYAGDPEYAAQYDRDYQKALHQWEEDAGMQAARESDFNIPLS